MNTQDISSLPLPPGDSGLPFIGETVSFFTDSEFNQKKIAKYGKVYRTNIFGNDTVTMIGAEANNFLLRNENKYVVSTWPKSTRILLGDLSLAVKNGEFHKSRRQILYQAFQPRALDSYIPTMEEITQRYIDKWLSAKELTWYPQLRDYTFDIASNLLVGSDGGSDSILGELFEDWCAGLFTIPVNLPWTKFGRALRCRKKLLKYIEEIVIKRQQLENTEEDALGLLIRAEDEAGNKLTTAELKDQVLLLLFAGHETLTSAIASFCLLTAQNPDVMAKLRAEQAKFVSNPVTLDTIKEMTYLDMVIKEVMRIIPPVGGGFRKVIESFAFSGYQIPEGYTIQYQIAQTHQDQNIYTEKDKFDPDRFSVERQEDKQANFAYIPFGGGLRECLGKEFARLEMRIFAAKLLQQCQWELLPNQNLELTTVPTPHPKDGLKVRFSKV